ncbi:hypothetical protein GFS31_13220 [Leptolyngbya sp. BL0902]|nr:hypothetical protein GFS31_13220 [Leptolyngbya sp. BL0902]
MVMALGGNYSTALGDSVAERWGSWKMARIAQTGGLKNPAGAPGRAG